MDVEPAPLQSIQSADLQKFGYFRGPKGDLNCPQLIKSQPRSKLLALGGATLLVLGAATATLLPQTTAQDDNFPPLPPASLRAATAADDQSELDPPVLQLPPFTDAPLELPSAPGVKKRIEQAIENGVQNASSGDPVLEGILQTLQSKGSVLDGSSLDTRENWDASPSPRVAPTPLSLNVVEVGSGLSDADYELAEQLLKTARLISEQRHMDTQRRELVQRLRTEAARMLQAPPQPVNRDSNITH